MDELLVLYLNHGFLILSGILKAIHVSKDSIVKAR